MATGYEGKCDNCGRVPEFYIEIRRVTNGSQREYWCFKCLSIELGKQQQGT